MRLARRMSRIGSACVAGVALVLALATSGRVAAAAVATCSETEVRAEGEPASYQWLALVKARGNWRVKVRALPALGAAYANWNAAASQVERCIRDAKTVRCIVSARPCQG